MRQQNIERQNRLTKGLCKLCVQPRIEGHPKFCEKHYISTCAYNAIGKCSNDIIKKLQDSFKFNPVCPYTKEPLIIGVNTHLDHILSKKNHPEKAQNIDNLEWVSEKANLAKNGMNKDEFIAFCRTVVANCS